MSSFGIRLKVARKSAQITQQQLADAAEINQSIISQYEKGRKIPKNFEDIIKMAEVLQCDIKWLQHEWRALGEHKKTQATKEQNLKEVEEMLNDLSDENLSLVLEFTKEFLRTR